MIGQFRGVNLILSLYSIGVPVRILGLTTAVLWSRIRLWAVLIKDASESTKKLISGKDSYDWYACSPWMQYGANPSGTKGYTVNRTPRQMGYGSTAHLSESDIVAGKALAVPSGTAPELKLYHVCTLLKFTVVNNTGSSVAITSLTL